MASTLQAGMACWPAPTQSVTPGRALFAKGLAKGCTSAHLQSIFSAFGTVTDCQIARHRSGRSAGFAIVTFLRNEEAVAAMQAMDNFLYMGRRLSVKWFSPERALEGGSNCADVLNMQTLQHALQLSALQPADLMAQLAQMLESPRIVPQQPQNPHVAAWLDNFMLAQQRDSPLHDPTQQPTQLDLLNLSALSLTDLPSHGLGMPAGAGFGTHPATPSSLDLPDGAVFVTATAHIAGGKAMGSKAMGSGGGGSGHLSSHHAHGAPMNAHMNVSVSNTAGGGGGGNLVLAHSRLAKWCTAPGGSGSAGGRSSAAQSFVDDASSDENASDAHASDDSSIATTTVQTLALTSCDAPSCSTEGSSPAQHLVALSEPGAAMPGPSPSAPPGTPASATCAGGGAAAAVPPAAVYLPTEGDNLLRSRAYAAAAAAAMANSRPGVVGSDPGNNMQQQQALNRQIGGGGGYAMGPVLPGVPPLPPLRTVATAPPAGMHNHHNHNQQTYHHNQQQQQHMHRGAMQHQHQGRASAPVFTSCGGGGGASSPDAALQQALRLQQALAEQARTMNAQQQYVDALAKLAAAREQVMAAASLLNNNNNNTNNSNNNSTGGMSAMSAASLPVPQAAGHSQLHHQQHHHHQAHPHQMTAPPPSPAAAASAGGAMGAYMTHLAAGPNVNPYHMPASPSSAQGAMPDLSTLLMFQNAASMSRPLY